MLVFTITILAVNRYSMPIAIAQDSTTQGAQLSPQPGGNPKTQSTEDNKAPSTENLEGWNLELEQMEKALARKGLRDSDFERLHDEAVAIHVNADQVVEQLKPELKTLRERYEQLGPIPDDKNQIEELEEIAEQRKSLAKQIAERDGAVKAAQLIIVKSRQIRDGIIETRRSRFVRSVTSRSHTIFDPEMWKPFQKDLGFFVRGFPLLMTNIVSSVSNNMDKSGTRILAVFGALILWIIILLALSRGFNRLKSKTGLLETDRSLKALGAFLKVLTNGVVPALLLVGLVSVIDSFGLFAGIHREFVFASAFAVAIAIIIAALAHSFIEPRMAERRISVLSDGASGRLMTIIIVAMIVLVISWVIYDAGRAMRASLEFGIAVKAIFALTVGILAAVALRLIRMDNSSGITMEAGRGLSIFLNWNVLKSIAWAGIFLIFVSLVTGYIALAEFTANQIILTSAVLALLWLVLEIIDENIVGCFQSSHAVNHAISETLGWRYRITEQVGVVLIGILRLAVISITILALLIPWGYRARDWVEWITAAFFGFKVGDITISVAVILSAIVVFLVGVIITRALKSWLAIRYLPTTKLDTGIRNSITTMFGYVGISIAAMMTVSFVGFDLTSLAFVAGALSVGIGFGLQSVVSNFVSGLILLVERPIKAGDWVVTSGGEGTVRKISVRSTEIETFDRATVIVPNATLITDSVVNWNHKSSMGRIKLAIGVGYDSNPQRVQEILLECANENSGILDIPNPVVYFMDFGASSLDFELRCYLADVGYGLSVKSELRYAVFAALEKEGISIPFPQQDVHIKGFQPAAGSATPAVSKSKAVKPRKRTIKTVVARDDD